MTFPPRDVGRGRVGSSDSSSLLFHCDHFGSLFDTGHTDVGGQGRIGGKEPVGTGKTELSREDKK